MDLSFSRRQHGKKTGLPGSHELASLLAEISVRQSVSPTAKAQMHTEKPRFSAASDHPEIAPFAPNDAKEAAAIEIASFNPEVADVMITQSKSS